MNILCELAKRFGPLLGRLLLGNLFVVAGYNKIVGFASTAGYMASKMPALGPGSIKALLVLTIIIELGGGLMVLLGWRARLAALALALFLIPVTLIFHPYWGLEPAAMRMQFIQFQKNMAIIGGLLYVVAFGSGAYSLQRRRD